MKQKIFLGAIVIVIIAVGVFYYLSRNVYKETVVYSADTRIAGDLIVKKGEQTTLLKGITLSVEGNVEVSGSLACKDGSLIVVAEGHMTINEEVRCEQGATNGLGIMLVAKGGFTMTSQARIVSDGNIQIVDTKEELATNQEAIDRKYQEASHDSGPGLRVGPFVGESAGLGSFEPAIEEKTILNNDAKALTKGIFGTNVAFAQANPPVVIAGKMTVLAPPPGVKRIVIFAFPNASGITLQDFELTGPDGRKGADDKGASCDAKGKDGEDAFRFNAYAPNMSVNNFTLNLGSGGAGGDGETTKDCKPGRAQGGNGGSSGNFKMTGASSFSIAGSFLINPGYGGAGGGATAYGKDGAASEDGGDATAVGGKGADNKKVLRVAGAINGLANVLVGDLVAGNGGSALASPGNGGNGNGCKAKGGKGGNGTATGGNGGDAKLTLGNGVGRAPLAKDIGGKGGVADASGAQGGNGGSCDSKGAGGNGGNGGNAIAKEGKGGMGSTGRQSDGTVLDETGGNGGNGGDGCAEGKGGNGGSGDPKGNDGGNGKNLCNVTPPPSTTGVVPGNSGTSAKIIKAIEYMGKYLPISQLIIEDEIGCGAEHWHAAQGVVMATDGSQVADPGPLCGYGKVSQRPVIEVPENKGR